jgi:hypothetical protein
MIAVEMVLVMQHCRLHRRELETIFSESGLLVATQHFRLHRRKLETLFSESGLVTRFGICFDDLVDDAGESGYLRCLGIPMIYQRIHGLAGPLNFDFL